MRESVNCYIQSGGYPLQLPEYPWYRRGMATIETPNASDSAALARMFKEDMDDLGIRLTNDELVEFAESLVAETTRGDPEFQCWVARLEEGGEAVGVILANLHYSLKFAGKALWIEELYVTPSARRNGLGRMLVDALLDWAEENEIKGVDLEAYQGNTPASILYRSMGFHRLGRERFYYRLGADEFL